MTRPIQWILVAAVALWAAQGLALADDPSAVHCAAIRVPQVENVDKLSKKKTMVLPPGWTAVGGAGGGYGNGGTASYVVACGPSVAE